MRPPLLLVVLASALLSACSRAPAPAPAPTLLVAYDFAAPTADPLRSGAPAWGRDFGLHHFGAGWASDGSAGWWALRPTATASLYLLGRGAELTLVWSAAPALSAAGQTVAVRLNGHELAAPAVPGGWAADTVRIAVPDAVLRQGLNELELAPRLALPDVAAADDPERRPLGVFVRALTVSATLDDGQLGTWARWLDPRATGSPWEAVPVPDRLARPRPRADRPDLLVVVLDALRPDHVGHQGYARATTPVLDGLAADGVVFTGVVSQASYTRCAVPGLLTGLPWTDHGVVHGVVWENRDALADSFVTLPEVLAAAGYHAIGVSDNPNFSAATGMAQGFAEFRQTWDEPGYAGVAAEAPERIVAARLAEGLPAEPVCLWLHLLPPHQPYAPGPDHDLWRAGPLADLEEAGMAELLACERPDTTVAAALPDRLQALYDGNIHRIDASLGRILAAWRALGRERGLVVAVVSDHGEGFGEHGRWDHCTTVHDEMTRVPLLLWPRQLCGGLPPRVDDLLAGHDLAPLLLRVLDIPLTQDRLPRRFLEVYRDGPRPREAVVLRAVVAEGVLGLRTDRHLAIWGGPRRQELYDLAADPGATVDLRHAQPELYNDLAARLHAVLGAGAWLGGGAPAAAFTPAELQRLKSLGYL